MPPRQGLPPSVQLRKGLPRRARLASKELDDLLPVSQSAHRACDIAHLLRREALHNSSPFPNGQLPHADNLRRRVGGRDGAEGRWEELCAPCRAILTMAASGVLGHEGTAPGERDDAMLPCRRHSRQRNINLRQPSLQKRTVSNITSRQRHRMRDTSQSNPPRNIE